MNLQNLFDFGMLKTVLAVVVGLFISDQIL
jgi:hypothetical protein